MNILDVLDALQPGVGWRELFTEMGDAYRVGDDNYELLVYPEVAAGIIMAVYTALNTP